MSTSEKLLTVEERDACQKVAASGTGLASQRATALLAIDEGATRAQASEQTSLTLGQVGYLLRTFRQKRLAMFPDAEPGEEQPPAEAAEPKKEGQEKKRAKKPKKDKEAKAKKKAKKSKKGKKAKSTKAEKPKKDKAAKKKSKGCVSFQLEREQPSRRLPFSMPKHLVFEGNPCTKRP
jgi:outer membrane biosynthesis protein TonB